MIGKSMYNILSLCSYVLSAALFSYSAFTPHGGPIWYLSIILFIIIGLALSFLGIKEKPKWTGTVLIIGGLIYLAIFGGLTLFAIAAS